MSETSPQFQAIAVRRNEIAAEKASVMAIAQARIDELDAENAELEIAARVLQRLGLLDAPAANGAARQIGVKERVTLSANGTGGRPTVPHMIRIVLSDLKAVGLDAASGASILEHLSQRWKVSDPNIVRPTLWRMVKDGRLTKQGDAYTLPPTDPGLLKIEPSSDISRTAPSGSEARVTTPQGVEDQVSNHFSGEAR